jgi:hypothetical protein
MPRVISYTATGRTHTCNESSVSAQTARKRVLGAASSKGKDGIGISPASEKVSSSSLLSALAGVAGPAPKEIKQEESTNIVSQETNTQARPTGAAAAIELHRLNVLLLEHVLDVHVFVQLFEARIRLLVLDTGLARHIAALAIAIFFHPPLRLEAQACTR